MSFTLPSKTQPRSKKLEDLLMDMRVPNPALIVPIMIIAFF